MPCAIRPKGPATEIAERLLGKLEGKSTKGRKKDTRTYETTAEQAYKQTAEWRN